MTVLVLTATLSAVAAAQPAILTQEPPPGTMRPGERVLVDDRKCPKGEIKQVVGGNNEAGHGGGAKRERSCIPHQR